MSLSLMIMSAAMSAAEAWRLGGSVIRLRLRLVIVAIGPPGLGTGAPLGITRTVLMLGFVL